MSILLALLSLLGCPPIGQACTDIGCVDGFDLPFDPALSTPGSIGIQVVVDGQTVSCAGTLPLPSDGSFPCDSDQVGVGTSGSSLSADQHEVLGLFFAGSPAQVAVTVQRDGVEIAAGEFSPEYVISQPNGEDCPPTCSYAQDSLGVGDP